MKKNSKKSDLEKKELKSYLELQSEKLTKINQI